MLVRGSRLTCLALIATFQLKPHLRSFSSPARLSIFTYRYAFFSCEIYVDKTDRIFELACQRKNLFLVRPKGFGKSLLVSIFESLFKDGLADFDGLAIARE